MSSGQNTSILHQKFHNPTLDAIISISIAAEFVRHNLDEICKKQKINGVQYNILRILKRHRETGCTRTQVLENLIEKSVDVTRSIDGLEKKGFVTRERVDSDRRLSMSKITEEGVQLLDKLDPEFYKLLASFESKMSVEEWKLLSSLCHKMAD